MRAFIIRRQRLQRDREFGGLRILPAWKGISRSPGPLETSRPGIFAAGDVRSGSVQRYAAAVGEGGMAVEGAHEVLGTYD